MPVDLQLEDGQLVVSVHDPSLSQQLMGQVVALSVGRQALWFRRGWTVTALGRLGSAETEGPDDGRCLPFEVAQLEGLTFVKHSQPITKGPSRVHG